MHRFNILPVVTLFALILGTLLPVPDAIGQQQDRQMSGLAAVNVASQQFIAAISARDIRAMDMVWVQEPYATFIGPLSTTVVVGWESVRKAWEMRFGQFDRVTISMAEPNVRIKGNVAWVVGVEKVELLRKDGSILKFDAFVTNIFENHEGRWLMVSHQATPMFAKAE